VTVIYRCERCRAEKEPIYQSEPRIPTGWEEVDGAHLCERCTVDFHRFLSGTDAVTRVNLNDRIWVKRDGKPHPYQLWELMHVYGPKLAISGPSPFDENTIYLREPRA